MSKIVGAGVAGGIWKIVQGDKVALLLVKVWKE